MNFNMENFKLNQLLTKLSSYESPSINADFCILDEKCEHLKGVSGGYNAACNNGTCSDDNGSCKNTSCSGKNRICSEL
jgi:hypothetical protein